MTRALIGYTGFVGANLDKARGYGYDFRYNSKNISDIEGCTFEELVCAGVSAVKWMANKYPAEDAQALSTLVRGLKTVKARHFILISTVDVYREPVGVTELDEPVTKDLHFYGLHRYKFEQFVRRQFEKVTIIRLPGLFGPGLRKNLVYDLMRNNNVEKIDPAGQLQWYDVKRLPQDMAKIVQSGVPLINIAPEPVATKEIADRFFPRAKIGKPGAKPPVYDMRTSYSEVLGGEGGYHISKDVVFSEIKQFIETEMVAQ